MDDRTLNLDENLDNIITLTDEDGEEVRFELLDLIPYEDRDYVVLLPMGDEDDGEVIILGVEEQDDETESYVSVDEETVQAVFALFKERFKDVFTFGDGE